MLNILWMIILIIILFIIILLVIGIKISFIYTKKESKINGCLKILILKKIKVYSLTFPSQDDCADENEKENEGKKRDFKKILELAKPCFKDLMEFLKKTIKSVKIKKIQNHLIFGMDDYAETGKYIGIIWAVLAIINPLDKNLRISAEPTFNGSRLDAKGENEFEIYPLKLLIPVIKLVSKKEIRNLIRGVLDER